MTGAPCATAGNDLRLAQDTGNEITVLYVDDAPGYVDLVEQFFDDDPRLRLRAVSSREATERLDGVDCVVSEYTMPGRDGLELLAAVRERDPTLPFVLFTHESRDEVADSLLSWDWTDYLQKRGNGATMALLARRVSRLVDHRRASTLARRALSALDLSREGTAIAGPAGTVQVVNRAFATQFGSDRDDLLGRAWPALFTDSEVEHLRSAALPRTEEGWQWTGQCVGRRADGDTFRVRLAIARLEDGSLAFTVRERDQSEE